MTPLTDLPVVSAPDPDEVPEPARRVAGILLAAGTSTRFGEDNKLLALVDDDPIVVHAARSLVAAGLDPLIAVVGYEADRITAALDGFDLRFVENNDYEDGQATSVQAGVDALPTAVDAAVFALADMPDIDPESIRALVASHRVGSGTALAAACDGQRGNPVLFDAIHFDSLMNLSGDTGGRRLLVECDTAALVETGDAGVHRDVDSPDDL